MMFLLPKNFGRNNEEADWWFRTKVFVVFCVGTVIALLATFLKPGKAINWEPNVNEGQRRFLVTIDVFECFFFGIGFVFLIIVGPVIPKVTRSIRWKVIGMYISAGWMLISWFPHLRLHAHYKTPNATIAIDISFHWTMAAATIFLSTFIYKFLRRASEWKNQGELFSRTFWKSDYFHAIVIFLVFFFVTFFVISPQFHDRRQSSYTTAQEAGLIIVDVSEAILHSVANAFLIKMCFVLYKIDNKSIKYRGIPVVIAIWWLTASWWFHTKVHTILPTAENTQDPVDWILVTVFFHWTSILSAGLIAFNIYGLISMAVQASRSPWRSGTSGAEGATYSGTGDTTSGVELRSQNSA